MNCSQLLFGQVISERLAFSFAMPGNVLSKKECTKSLFLSRISVRFLRVESDFFVICGLIKYSRGSRGKCGILLAVLLGGRDDCCCLDAHFANDLMK